MSSKLPRLPGLKLPSMSMLLWKRQPAGAQTGPDYVDDKYFAATIVAAVALHIGGIYLYHLMPRTEVVDIPVHALSIKLGDGEALTPEEQKLADINSNNKTEVETAISKIAVAADVQEHKAATTAMDKTLEQDKEPVSKVLDKAIAPPAEPAAAAQDSAQKLAAIAKQFVRNNNVQAPSAPKGTGNILGNSTEKDAELMSRYDQLISAWIGKFKLYPEEARTQGLQGETVVRIRIDRKGNIRYYILEHSTGSQLLDRAAIEMVKRANPVPAAPNDYPAGELLEFLIPVNFTLQ